MTLFETKAKKVEEFHDAALPAGLLDKMHPDKRAIVANFVKEYRGAKAPAAVLRDYYLKLAPIEATFARTRDLARAAVGLLESWSIGAGNAAQVQAETGAWLLGNDEADDLERLQKFAAAFARFYGAGGLLPALKPDELRKQVAAHLKARAEKPAMPPGQQLSALQASHRDLTADCDLAFKTFHDFLDGYFGKSGNEAYAEKSTYGYDRRAGRYRGAKEVAQGAVGATQPAGNGAAGGNGATAQEVGTPAAGAATT